MRCWLRTKTVWWCTLIKVNRHLKRQFRSEHTRWQFAITCRGDTCVLDDFCENLYRRNMSQKKSNQTEFVRLVAGTKFCCRENFSPKNLLYTRSHLSLRYVAATCWYNYPPDLHTKSDLSPRRVSATHRLVCFDLYALLGPVYIEVGDPR